MKTKNNSVRSSSMMAHQKITPTESEGICG